MSLLMLQLKLESGMQDILNKAYSIRSCIHKTGNQGEFIYRSAKTKGNTLPCAQVSTL